MDQRVIHLHVDAPPKPAVGAACNGCGACCAVEPCPVGMLLSRRRTGRCDMLTWSDVQRRYRCGLLGDASHAPAFNGVRRWLQRRAARWISAGSGCDADFAVESPSGAA